MSKFKRIYLKKKDKNNYAWSWATRTGKPNRLRKNPTRPDQYVGWAQPATWHKTGVVLTEFSPQNPNQYNPNFVHKKN